MANVNAQLNMHDLDSMLREIEIFQEHTDLLVENMQQIDRMIERDALFLDDKKVGLNAEQLKRIRLFTFQGSTQEVVCSVCLAAARKSDRVYELPCKHIFHQKCLEPWFKQSTICPNCRRDVLN
jgi:Ring finger domain